ncbi:MAG: bifunctional nicotinamidase/pyrazinamidase [Promethearchaeota archaeon]|nr:MAG: bifunctional nicotinamidase/pyrazinamidase [Candidatus Lokiarchaeota archaeon]
MLELEYLKSITINQDDALLVVDIQNDFIPGGALAVEDGDLIIEGINNVANIFKKFSRNVVLTQDWHPKDHKSFASQYPGKDPGDEFQTDDGSIGPVLWPDHCVQGTKGAEFHVNLESNLASIIVRKGRNPNVDSYSAFLENDKKTETGLAGYLKSINVKRVFICGLALDYCCYFSAMDGIDFGFEVYLIVDLSKGIDLPPGNISKSIENMKDKGVKFANQDSFK